MRYRLGILGGLAIIGIVALGMATGISGSGTVEAAKPAVTVTNHFSSSALTTLQGSCDFSIQITWEGNAFAHKNEHYHLFLTSQQDDGPIILYFLRKDTVDKRTARGVVQGRTFIGTPDTNYYSWIVFFTSKGKGGAEVGRQMVRNELNFNC